MRRLGRKVKFLVVMIGLFSLAVVVASANQDNIPKPFANIPYLDQIPVIKDIKIGPGAKSPLESGLLKDKAQSQVDDALADTNPEVQQALGQSNQVAEQIKNRIGEVLGKSVGVNDDPDKSITEQTFEYGRYVYCQEVVKNYEIQQSKKQPE